MSIKSRKNWIPWGLMALAFAAAFAYTNIDHESAQRYAAGIFAVSLGTALLLWGIEEMQQGRIRSKRVYVSRTEAPTSFLVLLAAKRFVPAIVMVGAAIWIVFFRTV